MKTQPISSGTWTNLVSDRQRNRRGRSYSCRAYPWLDYDGFDQHSDCDFVIAVERELRDEQVQALQAMHGRICAMKSGWAQHLEGSYFPKEILRDRSRRGERLWYLDNGSRAVSRSDHCNAVVAR
jgi:hypothetical protein